MSFVSLNRNNKYMRIIYFNNIIPYVPRIPRLTPRMESSMQHVFFNAVGYSGHHYHESICFQNTTITLHCFKISRESMRIDVLFMYLGCLKDFCCTVKMV